MSHHNAKCGLLAALVGALLGLLPDLGWASDARIVFDRLSLSEGLSQSNVFAFTQDRDGYLWMGTQNAADRFDGHGIWSFRFYPNDPQSLTRGSVTGFHNGPLGHLWITTEFGITRLDADTKKMKRVFEADSGLSSPLFSVTNGIQRFCDDQIISVFSNQAWRIDPVSQTVHAVEFVGKQPAERIGSNIQDNNGAMWLSDGADLWKSECQDHSLRHHSSTASDGTYKDFGQSLLAITPLGHLAWAGGDGLRLIDPASGQQLSTIKPSEYGEASDQVLAVNTDHLGGLWLFTREALIRVVLDDSGLVPRQWNEQFAHNIDLDLAESRPSMFIKTSGDGLIWVSVANTVGVYRPAEQSFQSFQHDPFDEKSLPPTVGWNGYDLFVDDFGVIWIGAKLGGVARYIPQRHRFTHIKNPTRPAYVVRGIGKQRVNQDKYLWVGLDDGGIELWQAKLNQGFEKTSFVTVDNNHGVDINRMRIRSMATHPITGEVWFNSGRYLGVADANDRTVTIHSVHPDQFTRNRALAFSPDGRFLYQVIGQNLIQHEFNSAGDWLDARPLTWLPGKINSFRLGAIHVLNDGTLLMAAEDSFFAVMPWNQTVQAINVLKPQSDPTKTAVPNPDQHRVVSMLALDDGTLWLGTEAAGLFETEIKKSEQGIALETKRVWSEDNGLPDVTIYAITQDSLGHIWASSNRGLSQINPNTSNVLNFGLDDGLQADEFNTGVAHKAQDGSLYFGGINGVSLFQPTKITAHPLPPRVHLEDVFINEERMDWRLENPLDNNQNNWVFHYAGLHFAAPERNRFAYQLEGLDLGWVEADRERVARYAGLNPGQYRFWVRSANGDGVWSEPRMLFEARILPPSWLSPMAYALYGLLVLVAMAAFAARARQRRMELEQLVGQRTVELKTKNELVLKQSAALQEALNARTLFFANISHELRTPLTLIDANLNSINQALPNHESVGIAQHYLKRLVRLVDQLLDMSKMRLHGVQTAPSPWSLDHLLKTTLKAYEGVAQEKSITLTQAIEPDWYTRADQASIEKILLNLLTNAIKFTPKQGRVHITLEADPTGGVWLAVADTGPGIPVSEQDTIFERFHRVPVQESQRVSGAGLGLALVSEAVGAIGGRLKLDSQLGSGAEFSVWLPAQQGFEAAIGKPAPEGVHAFSPVDTDTEIALIERHPSQKPTPAQEQKEPGRMGTLLIVEDNEDLRKHLAGLLTPEWMVHTATDGLDALESLKAHDIDVILSDIMMPRLDGLALLEQVRDDLGTSHIPFLFLTARGDDETELKSLMLAADGFLRKPFDPQVLELKLKNLLINRKRLQAHLDQAPQKISRPLKDSEIEPQTGPEQPVGKKDLSPRDHRFLERLSAWMEAHYTEPDLTVANLAQAMAVDERTLQRKTRALFGHTPAHFINEYRIRKACEALTDPTVEIQEVAYQTGYSNPRYFSRVFTKHRGQSPSQWRKNHQK